LKHQGGRHEFRARHTAAVCNARRSWSGRLLADIWKAGEFRNPPHQYIFGLVAWKQGFPRIDRFRKKMILPSPLLSWLFRRGERSSAMENHPPLFRLLRKSPTLPSDGFNRVPLTRLRDRAVSIISGYGNHFGIRSGALLW